MIYRLSKFRTVQLSLLFLLLLSPLVGYSWGFYGHKRINRLAVFTLPPEMLPFFKHHINFISENAVNPDKRRYAVKDEAPRHYIDLDLYGDSAVHKLPRYWKEAEAKYSKDTLMANGIVPWHINFVKYQLTEAMRTRNVPRILRLAADIGHYIADAHVPLHTTSNYNGQKTGQRGIHGLWESRLPELLAHQYDFFVGPAQYLDNPQLSAWAAVAQAHQALDSVLGFERLVSSKIGEDKKYTFEERGSSTVKVYSAEFCKEYHNKLNGQVERQMRASVKMVGNFWYTCWVDAGQPDLTALLNQEQEDKNETEVEQPPVPIKSREDDGH